MVLAEFCAILTREAVRACPDRRRHARHDASSTRSRREALFDRFFAAESAGRCRGDGRTVRVASTRTTCSNGSSRGARYLEEKRGEYSLRWKSKSGPFFNNVVEVPADYDPAQTADAARAAARRCRPSVAERAAAGTAPAAGRAPNRIEGEKQIYLHPSGWAAAQWWDEEQIDNILRAVDALKRKYNIDETQDLPHRHFRWWHRRLLHGAQGAEPVVVLPAAQRQPRRASQSRQWRRRRDARQQPGRRAAVCRQRRARSALPGGAGRAAHRLAEADGRQRDVPSAGRRRAQHRVVADRTGAVRAVRARPSARGAPGGAVMGNRAGRSIQPQSLAGDQRAARRCVAVERADRSRILPSHRSAPAASISGATATPSTPWSATSRRSRCCCRRMRSTSQAGGRDRQRQAGVQRPRRRRIRW